MGRDQGGLRRRAGRGKESLPHHEADDPNWPYAKGKLDPLGKFVGIAVLFITTSLIAYFRYQQHLRDIVITPLDSPKIIAENATTAAVSPDRFWGTYRSNTYFGLKTRTPKSPVFGLMWLTQFTNQMPPPVRHWCNQGDHLLGYSWLMHDGKTFGVQELEEPTYTVKTEFVKRKGGDHGGDWTARITMTPKDPMQVVVVSSMFYVALDGQGSVQPSLTRNVLTGVTGHSEELGDFTLRFPKAETNDQKVAHLITYASSLALLTDTVKAGMKVEAWDRARTLPYFTLVGRMVPKDSPGPNFVVKEVTATLPLEMEVVFESGSFRDRPNALEGDVFTAALNAEITKFNTKFSEVFQLEKKQFKAREIKVAKAAISNMLGSVGYFYGSSLVQSEYNKEPVYYWNASLFTGVPSRPFFPRGFLWDEGFHNLLISRWDEELSREIIGHWLDLMNTEGWIPREQILGPEARAYVPAQFVVQRNKNANPPTFFLPLQRLIHGMVGSKKPDEQRYLEALYPRLKAWYAWYNVSQVGSMASTYRWRGRDSKAVKQLNPQTLTSGLDDYPRASHPTDEERHVDLRCWIALASGVMAEIAKALNKDWEEYAATHKLLTDNALLDHLHWSEKGQQYSDYGLHTDKVKLEKPPPPPNLQPGQRPPQMDKIRVTVSDPKNQFVNAFGYVSLFPFLLKIINPDSPKLYRILTDLRDPGLLWTDYGLRSLARSNRMYNRYNTEHDAPYWRGAIWININYLALGDKTGEGKGSHPFTGWSALLVLIMGEVY
ncbi:hypothetical protein BaRGS_00029444 [Batillaria attramentaria]|uniref:Mannosyl-oligosaccharide glucosidase n=1 Tax=Batillaria attramentaria TaxID=370345 RepID=A0ABD0JXB1_9CAEN